MVSPFYYSKLQIYAQELLGQDTHDEGYHSNGDADDRHAEIVV